MGDWLKIYGESIYGTLGGPYTPNEVYSATRKGDKVYIHLFNASAKEITLPALPGVKVLKASLMNGGAIQVKEISGKYILSIPAQLPDSVSNVLVLQTNESVEYVPAVKD